VTLPDAAKWLTKAGQRTSVRTLSAYIADGCPASAASL